MERQEIPDTSKWVENTIDRKVVRIGGRIVGFGKNFFSYDAGHPDARFRKLMRRCLIFYAFGVECAAKSWIVYKDDGSGMIRDVIYSAILIDAAKDQWVVGLPEEIWDVKTEIRDGKLLGIKIFLKTEEGVRVRSIANPENGK